MFLLFCFLCLTRHFHEAPGNFSFASTMLTPMRHHILKVAMYAGFMYKVTNPAYME